MYLTTSIGTKQNTTPKFYIEYKGNWNYKNNDLKPVFTKPIGIVVINGNFVVWNHQELLDLIKLYVRVDDLSIKMIKNNSINTGSVNHFEKSLKDKILEVIQPC